MSRPVRGDRRWTSSARPQPGGRLEGGGRGGEHSFDFLLRGSIRAFSQQLIRGEGLEQFRAVEAVGPDINFTHGRTCKGENLEWEQDPLKEKMVASATAEDHHAIRRIAIGTILLSSAAVMNPQVQIRIVQ